MDFKELAALIQAGDLAAAAEAQATANLSGEEQQIIARMLEAATPEPEAPRKAAPRHRK